MELIVVVALLSILLVFAIPRFESTVFQDDANRSSRWIITKIQMLKESALRDQKQYVLHVNLDNNEVGNQRVHVPGRSGAGPAGQQQIPGSLRIIDVEYPSRAVNTGVADIRFFKGDTVTRHDSHRRGDTRWSFLVEPFLSEVGLIEGYADFEN